MKNKVKIQPDIVTREFTDQETEVFQDFEKQIIVHCFISAEIDMVVRIWHSTSLIGKPGGLSKLIHIFNITYAPEWTAVRAFSTKKFTLIFQALPPEVLSFSLYEKMPGGSRGFYVVDIQRNKSDVYKIYL